MACWSSPPNEHRKIHFRRCCCFPTAWSYIGADMSRITIIVAPFHAGVRGSRVGNGPQHLLETGLVQTLQATGAEIEVVEVEPVDHFEGEIGRSFEVMRRVARAVASAREEGCFPLVLAGNCNSSVGVHAGLAGAHPGIIWFDAHPDFDTPDECMSGYFDGMGVATLAGQCWHRLAATIPGFQPVDLSRLVYCGIRDFEPGQREKVESYGVGAVYGSAQLQGAFAGSLDVALTGLRGQHVLVHLDLDCLDTSVGQANEYAAPGGLTVNDLLACLERVVVHTLPIGMTIASFDPELRGSQNIAAAAVKAAEVIARSFR